MEAPPAPTAAAIAHALTGAGYPDVQTLDIHDRAMVLVGDHCHEILKTEIRLPAGATDDDAVAAITREVPAKLGTKLAIWPVSTGDDGRITLTYGSVRP